MAVKGESKVIPRSNEIVEREIMLSYLSFSEWRMCNRTHVKHMKSYERLFTGGSKKERVGIYLYICATQRSRRKETHSIVEVCMDRHML